MLKLIAHTSLALLSNAVGLIGASILIDGFSIDGVSFLIAVGIFTAATAILSPLVLKIAVRNAPYLVGGIALVTTLIGLIVTDLLSDGLTVDGFGTWFIATFVVWIVSIIGSLTLPLILFRQALAEKKQDDD